MHIEWWYWICAGILLLLAEAVTPGGFYLLFIGIAAVIAGCVAPFIPATWIEVTIFALLSGFLILFFRKPMVERLKRSTPQADAPEFINETARTIEPIPAGAEGMVELRGASWKAHNTGTQDLAVHSKVKIVDREGLTLIIKAE